MLPLNVFSDVLIKSGCISCSETAIQNLPSVNSSCLMASATQFVTLVAFIWQFICSRWLNGHLYAILHHKETCPNGVLEVRNDDSFPHRALVPLDRLLVCGPLSEQFLQLGRCRRRLHLRCLPPLQTEFIRCSVNRVSDSQCQISETVLQMPGDTFTLSLALFLLFVCGDRQFLYTAD